MVLDLAGDRWVLCIPGDVPALKRYRPTIEMKPRIIIADDNTTFLHKFVAILSNHCDVVATAQNGIAALQAIREFKPDVAVLDLEMPGLNGIEVTVESRKDSPELAIIICSVHRDQELIEAAAAAGALGYVFKEDAYRDLVAAVDFVSLGTSFFPRNGLS